MRIFRGKDFLFSLETLVNIAAKYFNALYSNGKKKKFVKIKYRVFKFRVLLKDLVFNDTICIWGHFSCSTGCKFFSYGYMNKWTPCTSIAGQIQGGSP